MFSRFSLRQDRHSGRDGNGNTVVSLVNGGAISSSVLIVTLPAPWSLVGVGDFNNDGSADILWSNLSTGDTVISLMNAGGTAIASSAFVVNLPPAAWSVAGVGDFNGDARSDILWRNSSGDTVVSLTSASGAAIASSTFLTRLGAPWSVAALGDFNADGRSDILWRNTSDATVASFIGAGGTAISSSALVASVPANWQVMGANQN
ncbi:MAG: VCBS repeat-containing protein [Methylocystis sp.]|nr:VCBS repeat-containing protein [Methylocystis sp.]